MGDAVKQSALISLRGLLTSKPAVWLCSMGDGRTVICSDKVALAIVDGTLPASLKLPVVHSTKWLVDHVVKCVERIVDSCKVVLHRVSVARMLATAAATSIVTSSKALPKLLLNR